MHSQHLYIRILFIAAAVLFSFSSLQNHADDVVYHHEIQPLFASATSQGGSASMDGGLASLFWNPSSATLPGSGLHLAESHLWTSASPLRLSQAWNSAADNGERLLPMLIKLEPEFSDGGLRTGFLFGVARTGAGLNIGLMVASDLALQGGSLADVEGVFVNQISGHLGWNQEFSFMEQSWTAGVQVRPLIRTQSAITSSDFFREKEHGMEPVEDGLGQLPTLSGTALAVDAGLRWQAGDVALSVYGRNIFSSPISYTINRFDVVRSELLEQFGIPATSQMDQTAVEKYLSGFSFRMPTMFGIGFVYNPEVPHIDHYISPRIHADYKVVLDGEAHDPLESLGAGIEFELLRFVQVRGGITAGQVTSGIGIRLWLLDASWSYYSMDLNPYKTSGDTARTNGMSFELGIRF